MHLTKPATLFSIFKKHPYISTDSRKAMPGSLFFALKGDSFDGNKYAQQALEQGAAFAVIDNPEYFNGEKTLLTNNVLDALQQLASDHRQSLNIPIIGITGSNGKTTTKELLATALSARFNTLATTGNLNNHIGVPITLLNIRPDTEIAVIEMGANHIGEIAALCQIARPSHGLITNIGKAHLEGFGGPEGVIKGKSELYHHLRMNGGTVFVNADNHLLMGLSDGMHRITYGKDPNSNYSGHIIEGINSDLEIEMASGKRIDTKLTGGYNFENVMAAVAVAGHFRVNADEAAKAIAGYEPRMNRSQVMETGKNRLILDAYNANPSSMVAAITNFARTDAKNKVLILGDMFELGQVDEEEHTRLFELIDSLGFKRVLSAGPCFLKAALGNSGIHAFETVQDLHIFLEKHPITGANILIKGSRGMKMESLTGLL